MGNSLKGHDHVTVLRNYIHNEWNTLDPQALL